MRKKFSYFSIFLSLLLVSSSFAQTTTTTVQPDFPPSYYDIVAMFLIAIYPSPKRGGNNKINAPNNNPPIIALCK